MSEFVVKALEYGVLGLCAVMLVLAYNVIVKEQQRDGQPRKGIIRFTTSFMAFCLILAVLNTYVQLTDSGNELASAETLAKKDAEIQKITIDKDAEIQRTVNELDTLKKRAIDVIDIREGILESIIEGLDDDDPRKERMEDLRRTVNRLKEIVRTG